MVNSQKDRYAEIVRRGIEKSGASEPGERENLYERLRVWNEQTIAKRDDADLVAAQLRIQLEEAIAEYEAGLYETGQPEQVNTPDNDPFFGHSEAQAEPDNQVSAPPVLATKERSIAWPVAAALVAGLIAGAGAIYLWASARTDVLASVEQARPLVDDTTQFLRKVRDEIISLQKSAPDELKTKAGERFVRVTEILPALGAEEAGLAGPPVTVVRADEAGYKVLVISPVCPAARLLEPDLVDLVRDKYPFVCSYFGYWNEAGAKF